MQRDSPPPAPVSHIPCPVSPLNVPNLGFRPSHLLSHLQQETSPLIQPRMTSSIPSPLPPPPPPLPSPPMTKVISSPIRVPIPPTSIHHGLKRSHFSNLAHYLSGSSSPPPPIPADPSSAANLAESSSPPPLNPGSMSKRRKTTPKKKPENHSNGFYGLQPTPRYSGSISSLTASPASPPHSHSTEGEGPLEICEESDR